MSDPSKVLDELERLAKGATPGRWSVSVPSPEFGCQASAHTTENAAHIAAANPETVLRLIEVARLALEGATGGFTPDVARDIRAALEKLGGTGG